MSSQKEPTHTRRAGEDDTTDAAAPPAVTATNARRRERVGGRAGGGEPRVGEREVRRVEVAIDVELVQGRLRRSEGTVAARTTQR